MRDPYPHPAKERIGSKLPLCAGIFLSLLGSGLLPAQTAPDSPPHPTPAPTFLECHSLPQLSPVFKGEKTYEVTVIFKMPEKQLAIVTDGTENSIMTLVPASNLDLLEVGDRMRVTGRLRKSSYSLVLAANKIVKIGRGDLKEPVNLPDNPTRKKLRKFNIDRVRIKGRILTVTQITDQVQIVIQGPGFHYLLRGPAMSNDEIFSRVGSITTVEGLFWFPFDAKTVDTPFDIPQLFFANQSAFKLTGSSRTKIEHLRGQTLNAFGDGRPFLRVPGQAKLVELHMNVKNSLVFEAPYAECWGQLSTERGAKDSFAVSSFRLLDPEESSLSEDIPPADYIPGDASQNLMKVTVTGKLTHDSPANLAEGSFTLTTKEEGAIVRIMLPNSVSLIDEELLNAQELRVTGYLKIDGEVAGIYPQNFRGIEVLGEPFGLTLLFFGGWRRARLDSHSSGSVGLCHSRGLSSIAPRPSTAAWDF